MSVGGARIPAPVLRAVAARMRGGPFRTADLVPVASASLAEAGGPVTVAYQVAERVVRRAVREGRVRRRDVDARRVVTWEWTPDG